MNNLSLVLMDISVQNRQEAYKELANQISLLVSEDTEKIEELLYYRERQGSIEVAKGVLLPHCEGNFQHHVLVITRLKPPIREWSKDIQCVDLIIGLAIAVSQDKSCIKTLMRRLADESFINQLKQLTKEELREIIYGKQRYS